MNLSDQIKLIDDLIRENPEHTIRDFMETIADIDKIKPESEMNKPVLYSAADAEFMILHAGELTVRQISDRLGIPESTVRNFGTRYKLSFRSMPMRLPMPTTKRKTSRPRPAAVYSNSGHLSTAEKYL